MTRRAELRYVPDTRNQISSGDGDGRSAYRGSDRDETCRTPSFFFEPVRGDRITASKYTTACELCDKIIILDCDRRQRTENGHTPTAIP